MYLSNDRRRFAASVVGFLILSAIVIWPICDVEIPAFKDYPGHLARMYILQHMQSSPYLSHYYIVDWRPIPYLAMDATFLFLRWIPSIYTAGTVFVSLTCLLPCVALFILHYVLHRKLSIVPFLGFLFCYNSLLIWGFLNYLPTAALAIIAFAFWVHLEDRGWLRRLCWFLPIATALYFAHLVAFGAFGLMAGSWELGRIVRASRKQLAANAIGMAVLAVSAIPAFATAILAHDEHVFAFIGAPVTRYGTLGDRIRDAFSPVLIDNHPISFVTAGAIVLLIGLGVAKGQLTFSKRMTAPAIVLTICSAAAPEFLFDVFGLDFRLPLILAILLVASIAETPKLSGKAMLLGIACVSALVVVRAVSLDRELVVLDGEMQAYHTVAKDIPRGVRVIVVDASSNVRKPTPNWPVLTQHAGMVALMDREVFLPTLFTFMTTVRTRPEMLRSSTPSGAPLPHLDTFLDGYGQQDPVDDELNDGLGGRIYWLGWEKKFDYVLIEHFGKHPNSLPPTLQPVAASDVVDLFRIVKSPAN